MRYKKIRIKNYKAISDLTLDFSTRSLIPLIGLNETGKSSILEAIFAFDESNDALNEGKHVSYNDIKNKYEGHTNINFKQYLCEIKFSPGLRFSTSTPNTCLIYFNKFSSPFRHLHTNSGTCLLDNLLTEVLNFSSI